MNDKLLWGLGGATVGIILMFLIVGWAAKVRDDGHQTACDSMERTMFNGTPYYCWPMAEPDTGGSDAER